MKTMDVRETEAFGEQDQWGREVSAQTHFPALCLTLVLGSSCHVLESFQVALLNGVSLLERQCIRGRLATTGVY